MNKIHNSFYLIYFVFSIVWEINKHNQVSAFFNICKWILRAKTKTVTVSALSNKIGFNKIQ